MRLVPDSPTSSWRRWSCGPRSLAALLVACMLFADAASGQCIDYGEHLRWVASMSIPNWMGPGPSDHDMQDIHVAQDYAYVATGPFGDGVSYCGSLVVMDITEPTAPHVAGMIRDVGATAVTGSGDYAYFAWAYYGPPYGSSGLGFSVADVSTPTSPQITANRIVFSGMPPDAICHSLAVAGSHAYLAYGELGLLVFDVSDPQSPQLVNTVVTPGRPRAVVVAGNLAYVADGDAGLQVIDVTNPTSPIPLGSTSTSGPAQSVALAGQHVCVLSTALQVVDVSVPSALQIVATVPASGQEVVVTGAHAYVTGQSAWPLSYLTVVDISHPDQPLIVGMAPSPGFDVALGANGFHLFGIVDSWWWTGTGGELQVLDITGPVPAPIIGSSGPFHVSDVAVVRELVCASTEWSDLRVIDVADPTDPQTVGAVSVPGALSVAASGCYAHVGTGYGYSGLQEIDISLPSSPQIVGGVPLPAPVRDVCSSGDIAFAAADSVYAIDVSNPASPKILGRVDTPGSARRLAVSGGYAYVAAKDAGLEIVDIDDPTTLQVVGHIDMPTARAVTVAGEYAYMTTGEWGGGGSSRLHVVDVSNPASPQIRGQVDTRDIAMGVAVAEQFVYVAGGGWDLDWHTRPGLLQVIDVTDAFDPQVVGSSGWTYGSVTVEGELVFAPTFGYTSGYGEDPRLCIYPVHCGQPIAVSVSNFSADQQGRAVLLSWFTAFEAMFDGFNLYRSKRLTSGYARLNESPVRGHSPYSYLDRTVGPDRAYYYQLGAVDLRGHEVFYGPVFVTTPTWSDRTELHLASPSPFRCKTVLNFTLATPSEVRLAVYDVGGRLVRVLLEERLPAGDHAATWDGQDDRGLRVAGGTYFVKFVGDDTSRTTKVVYLGR